MVFFKLNKFCNKFCNRFHVKGFKSAAENIAAYIRQSQANVTKKEIPVKIHGRTPDGLTLIVMEYPTGITYSITIYE